MHNVININVMFSIKLFSTLLLDVILLSKMGPPNLVQSYCQTFISGFMRDKNIANTGSDLRQLQHIGHLLLEVIVMLCS